jgi:hypothetical protein
MGDSGREFQVSSFKFQVNGKENPAGAGFGSLGSEEFVVGSVEVIETALTRPGDRPPSPGGERG